MKKLATFLLQKPFFLGLGTFIINLFMSISPILIIYFRNDPIYYSSESLVTSICSLSDPFVIQTLLYAFSVAILISSLITFLAYYLQKSYVDIEKLSHHDGLTGLLNRLMFMTIFKQEIEKVKRFQNKLFLVIVDIDDFKPINDHYGHLIGDEAITSTAQSLKSIIRASDTIARFCGDEFVIAIVDKDINAAAGVINRILETFNAKTISVTPTQELQIFLSIGYTSYKHGDDFKSMLHRADQALYISKEAGKNTATFLA